MLQYASNKELHVPLRWVQTDVRMSRRPYALKGLGMQRRAQSVQTSYLSNDLSGLDKRINSEERRVRREHEFVLARS
jgi:hypothetical protein